MSDIQSAIFKVTVSLCIARQMEVPSVMEQQIAIELQQKVKFAEFVSMCVSLNASVSVSEP